MDNRISLVIFSLITLVIILFVYWLQQPKHKSYEETLNDLRKISPSTIAFCIGQNEKGEYLNVYGNPPIVHNEPKPIGLNGHYYELAEHGNIIDHENGFSIGGFNKSFECPKGFEGPNCKMIPICNNEENAIKNITYSQFNTLSLYNEVLAEHLRGSEPVHPRIYVKCKKDQEYELQFCRANELLNDKIECKPYDICEDKINGWAHNYIIKDGDDKLNETEFYRCSNNKSIKNTCQDKMVFSLQNQTCILKSQCYGKGNIQIKVDDHKYINCRNDIGTLIECENGLIEIDKKYQCVNEYCVTKNIEVDGYYLKYNSGHQVCNNNVLTTTNCTTETTNYELPKYWGKSFNITIANYPNKIWDGNACVTPLYKDILKQDKPISLSYGIFMQSAYDYSLPKDHYICNTKYYVDYNTGIKEVATDKPYTLVDGDQFNWSNPCHDKSEPLLTGFKLELKNAPKGIPFLYILKYMGKSKYNFVPNSGVYYELVLDDLNSVKLNEYTGKTELFALDYTDPEIASQLSLISTNEIILYPSGNKYTSTFYYKTVPTTKTTKATYEKGLIASRIAPYSFYLPFQDFVSTTTDFTIIDGILKYKASTKQFILTNGNTEMIVNSDTFQTGDIEVVSESTDLIKLSMTFSNGSYSENIEKAKMHWI